MRLGNAETNKLDITSRCEKKVYAGASAKVDVHDNNSALALICKYIKNGSTVLDVGCSSGYIGDYLNNYKNCIVDGIDYDEVSLELSQDRNCYRRLLKVDLNNCDNPSGMGYQESSYDYIIFADVLEHLINPRQTLVGFLALLKPNGEFLISVPDVGNADIYFNLMAGNFNYNEVGILDNTHLRFFTQNSFRQWVENVSASLGGSKLSAELIGTTSYESEFVQRIGQSCTILRDIAGTEGSRLQNIFSLKREGYSSPEGSQTGTSFTKSSIEFGVSALDRLIFMLNSLNAAKQNAQFVFEDNSRLSKSLNQMLESFDDLEKRLQKSETELEKIYRSRGWLLLKFLYSILHPTKQMLRQILIRVMRQNASN